MHPRVFVYDMEFYQPRYWGLDPVFTARVKLNIVDVLSLQSYPGFPEVYCMVNHPISSVHIMGDIVSISKKNRLIVYEGCKFQYEIIASVSPKSATSFDDGTGIISCCQWRKTEDSDEGLFIPHLGQLVSVFGRLSEFREEKQLKVSSIVPEEDPNAEPLHWLQTIHLKKSVYCKPFSLPPGITSDNTDDERFREQIHKVLVQYIQDLPNTFTLSELKSDKELERRCRCIVKDDGCDRLPEILMSIISELPMEGTIIPAKMALKTLSGETVYEAFSESKHLFPLILSFINARMKTPNGEKFGVPENWIVQKLKQKDIFCQLPAKFITTALEHLVEQSQIFPVGHKAYKCII